MTAAVPVVWWIRRDLRLRDNAALATARARGGPVVSVFILDPALLDAHHRGATRRHAFLFAGLRALGADLRVRGSRLVVLRGAPEATLRGLVAELGASGVVAEEDLSPYARRRDAAVGRAVPLTLEHGLPVVDAAMRQLRATGWVPNRARMIAASFLVKNLLVDWRTGEAWFMRELVDGDPAANNGGWQWVAGTGTDAAPYFRVFNRVLQARRFDPTGTYVRRWVPELARVPGRAVHEPWRHGARSGLRIGREYPAPLVDHGDARALAAYARARRR